MPITIQLPIRIEDELRADDPKLDDHAREQFLVAQYKEGKLSTSDIAEILGHETRFVTEQWLRTRGVNIGYTTADLDADGKTLDRLLGPVKR